MLVNLETILSDTRERKYAVGLFNCVTLEMTRGIIAAAEELNSPVIIGPGESLLPGATLAEYADMMLGMAKRAKVPVCLHFDHGFSPELVEEAIRLGYTSVMYDCSMLPFEENIRRSREMAAKAHAAGCSLEAEIGHVGSNGSAEEAINQSIYTQPEEALEFAAGSGCDALAVAIGTAHGVYKEKPKLNLDCLRAIAGACEIPLVLHGCTGMEESIIKDAIKLGVAKINFGTEVRYKYVQHYEEALKTLNHQGHSWKLSQFACNALAEDIKNIIRLSGSEGKA